MKIEAFTALIYGVLFGIPFALAAGPIFFLLVQTGVNRGVKYSLAIALGVMLSDAAIITATYFFIQKIQAFIINHTLAIQVGISFILMAMGMHSIFKRVITSEKARILKYNIAILFFLQGFILNLLNPSKVIVWTGVHSSIIHYSVRQHILFYLASFLTIAFLMITIANFSAKIEPLVKISKLRKINLISGLIYIGFSIYMILGGNFAKSLI